MFYLSIFIFFSFLIRSKWFFFSLIFLFSLFLIALSLPHQKCLVSRLSSEFVFLLQNDRINKILFCSVIAETQKVSFKLPIGSHQALQYRRKSKEIKEKYLESWLINLGKEVFAPSWIVKIYKFGKIESSIFVNFV